MRIAKVLAGAVIGLALTFAISAAPAQAADRAVRAAAAHQQMAASRTAALDTNVHPMNTYNCYTWMSGPGRESDGRVRAYVGLGCDGRPTTPIAVKVTGELFSNGGGKMEDVRGRECFNSDTLWCQPPPTSAAYRPGNWCVAIYASTWTGNDIYQAKQCAQL